MAHNVMPNRRNGVPALTQARYGRGAGPTPRALRWRVRMAVAPVPAIPAPPGRTPARPPHSLPCWCYAWDRLETRIIAMGLVGGERRAVAGEFGRKKRGGRTRVHPPRQSHGEARRPPGIMGEADRRTRPGRRRVLAAQGHAARAYLPVSINARSRPGFARKPVIFVF